MSSGETGGVLRERRQRNVEDRQVEADDEESEGERAERQPFPFHDRYHLLTVALN